MRGIEVGLLHHWKRMGAPRDSLVAGLVLGCCLLGDWQRLWEVPAIGNALGAAAGALGDAATQWMVFACAGMYFVTFTVLGEQRGGGTARDEDGGSRIEDGGRAALGRLRNPTVWLAALMVLAAVAYALHYAEAARSAQALTLFSGAVVGQGAAFWERRKEKAESRNEAGGTAVRALLLLLALAAMWQGERGHLFQYRGQARWTGPWDNPNTFGLLMGVGMVLAVGRLISRNAESRKLKAEMGGWAVEGPEHRTSNIERRTSKCLRWMRAAGLVVAAGVMGVGLVKSYSRGAWLGAVVGMAYLVLHPLITRRHANQNTAGMKEGWRGVVVRNTIVLVVIVVSAAVIGFWSFRQTGGAVARRAYSMANANDFSWRKRVAAYEGALQMMADRPWFGFGWNQPERVYDRYYRGAKVDEGMAIQLNDYLMLGMTLGVPALACFVVYVALALAAPRRTSNIEHRTSNLECGASDSGRWALDLAAACRAGAIVLLVGFWFDGGLFKLATGATFWVLLELGRETQGKAEHRPHFRPQDLQVAGCP